MSPRKIARAATAAVLVPLALVAVSTLGASPAHAQTPSSTSASPTAIREAEQRFEEGKTLFSQRRFGDARLKFEQACAVHRTVNCPKNLGLAEFELGQYVEASTHLREFLQAVRASGPEAAGLDAEGVSVIQKKYTEAFMHCGHVEVSAPAGARIIVQDRTIGTAPLRETIDVAAGEHTIEAHTDRGILRQKVTVGAGEVAPVRLTDATSDAHGTSPSQPTRTDRPGSSSARTVTLVSMYSVALIATGVGIGLTLHAQARKSDAEDKRSGLPDNGCNGPYAPATPCGELGDLRNTYDTDRKWATISFIGAGVFAAAATATFFLWPVSSGNEKGVTAKRGRVVPMLAPGLGGLGYAGSF